MPDEPLYEGPAHQAMFYVPSEGIARFGFSDPLACGYVSSPGGAMMRLQAGARAFVEAGQHVLTLYDPELVARVSITFEPR
jgi:hypothetical protein